MKMAAITGAVIGLMMSFVFWAMTRSPMSLIIIPAVALMGAAQGYLAPDYDDGSE